MGDWSFIHRVIDGESCPCGGELRQVGGVTVCVHAHLFAASSGCAQSGDAAELSTEQSVLGAALYLACQVTRTKLTAIARRLDIHPSRVYRVAANTSAPIPAEWIPKLPPTVRFVLKVPS